MREEIMETLSLLKQYLKLKIEEMARDRGGTPELPPISPKPELTQYVCECGGDMYASSEILTSFPPKIKHTCSNCGKVRYVSINKNN